MTMPAAYDVTVVLPDEAIEPVIRVAREDYGLEVERDPADRIPEAAAIEVYVDDAADEQGNRVVRIQYGPGDVGHSEPDRVDDWLENCVGPRLQEGAVVAREIDYERIDLVIGAAPADKVEAAVDRGMAWTKELLCDYGLDEAVEAVVPVAYFKAPDNGERGPRCAVCRIAGTPTEVGEAMAAWTHAWAALEAGERERLWPEMGAGNGPPVDTQALRSTDEAAAMATMADRMLVASDDVDYRASTMQSIVESLEAATGPEPTL